MKVEENEVKIVKVRMNAWGCNNYSDISDIELYGNNKDDSVLLSEIYSYLGHRCINVETKVSNMIFVRYGQ